MWEPFQYRIRPVIPISSGLNYLDYLSTNPAYDNLLTVPAGRSFWAEGESAGDLIITDTTDAVYPYALTPLQSAFPRFDITFQRTSTGSSSPRGFEFSATLKLELLDAALSTLCYFESEVSYEEETVSGVSFHEEYAKEPITFSGETTLSAGFAGLKFSVHSISFSAFGYTNPSYQLTASGRLYVPRLQPAVVTRVYP